MSTSSAGPDRPTDVARQAVLEYLYSTYKKSRSVKGNRVKISDLKTALKKQGYTENEIASALYYLIKTEFVDEVQERYPISRGGKTIRAESVSYRISDTGINHFEGPSKFQKSHKLAGINVTNIKGITQIGEGNIVQTTFGALYGHLEILSDEIRGSPIVSDDQKLEYQADINTIKSQLAKSKPDGGILRSAWNRLKDVATVGGLITTFEKVRLLIEPLLQ